MLPITIGTGQNFTSSFHRSATYDHILKWYKDLIRIIRPENYFWEQLSQILPLESKFKI